MTRDEAKKHLENGKYIGVASVWIFSKSNMYCDCPGCCHESFETIDDALNSIERYSDLYGAATFEE